MRSAKVVLTSESVDESATTCKTHQVTTEQYFPVVLTGDLCCLALQYVSLQNKLGNFFGYKLVHPCK